MKISIYAATSGALMAKPINEAKQHFEDVNLITIVREVSEANKRGRKI